MLRNLSLSCAVAAALLFPMTAFAGHGHGGHHGGGHHEGHHGGGHHEGHHDGGHHGGHWYHGRYWGYGVGACWAWTPYGYEWICY